MQKSMDKCYQRGRQTVTRCAHCKEEFIENTLFSRNRDRDNIEFKPRPFCGQTCLNEFIKENKGVMYGKA